MKFLYFFCALTMAQGAPKIVKLQTIPPAVNLTGAAAGQQFLAIATDTDGSQTDVTAEAHWAVSNPALAELKGTRITARGDGALNLTAEWQGVTGKSAVKISGSAIARPFQFSRDIGSILTKRGCNSSACHGGVKGRGGLKLSANALFPKDDYEWITKGGAYEVLTSEIKGERVPRVNVKDPASSLLLRKPVMSVPHGGGKRIETDSDDYRALLSWIEKGAPYGAGADGQSPRLARLEVYPALTTIPVAGAHHLLVTAWFSDGHSEDFTNQVLFSSSNLDVAQVSATGLVTGKALGETAIMIRAAGQLASAAVGVIGPPLAKYPALPHGNFIDEAVFAKLKRFNIVPSDVADDAAFLRRVCLDLTGTLPPPGRVREFVTMHDAHKREKVVDALIGSPEYIDYWTFRFSDIFRVSIFANGLTPKFSQKYWEWIRDNLAVNRPYDEVARERLSAQGYSAASRHFIPYNQIGPAGDVMAEEVRVFFGRRLDCAQCHNHPYENWSQDQFWGMAAFFGQLFKAGPVVFDHPTNMDFGSKDVEGSTALMHPRTKLAVKPVLLDSSPLPLRGDENPREQLARWMTSHPYFAEASVNRIWGYFFGRGIVDPVDDFRSTNPPTHPELLAALAKDFEANHYDLQHLMKTIVLSHTYQMSYRNNSTNKADVTNYSHSLPRALDAEVLLDAVVAVTGVPETFATAVSEAGAVGQAPARTRAINLKDPDMYFSRFLELYGRPNRGAIPERSGKPNLGQALHMLAGAAYVDRLSAPQSRLRNLLDRGASDADIFDDFYMAALGRSPDRDEVAELSELVSKRGDRPAALREFVWALISSREFAENH